MQSNVAYIANAPFTNWEHPAIEANVAYTANTPSNWEPQDPAAMQANVAYIANTPAINREPQDPVYSVIADDQTATPDYQEIGSDQQGADNNRLVFFPPSTKPHEEGI